MRARLGTVGALEAELLQSPERPIVLLERVEGDAAGRRGGARARRGRRHAADHAAPPPAAGPAPPPAGHDQRQPERRADRHRQRGGASSAWAPSPMGSCCTTGRSWRATTIRCSGPPSSGPIVLRRARGYAPAPVRLPVASPGPAARRRAAPQEHLRPGARPSGLRQPAHRRPREPRDAASTSTRRCSGSRRLFRDRADRRGPRPPSRLPLDPDRPGTRAPGAARGAASPRPRRGRHGASMGARNRSLAATFDGIGYGEDGTIWGGEILLADLLGFERVGHLRPAPLPGGDLAARTPWRAALGYLIARSAPARPPSRWPSRGVPDTDRTLAELQVARGLNTPVGLVDGPALRRRRRGARGPSAFALRGTGGDGARGAGGDGVPRPRSGSGSSGRRTARGSSIRCPCWPSSGRTASGATTSPTWPPISTPAWRGPPRRSSAASPTRPGSGPSRSGVAPSRMRGCSRRWCAASAASA